MKKTFLLLLITGTIALTSCEKLRSSLEVSDNSSAAINSEVAPIMTFNESRYDFGRITEGDEVSHVFKFANTGKTPLIIKDIKTQCGCTAADYPKDPVPPGATADIKVNFNSKGKPAGIVMKEVSIFANTQPEITKISIAAEILAKK
jgi:hypothetical protein